MYSGSTEYGALFGLVEPGETVKHLSTLGGPHYGGVLQTGRQG
mgnify:FL=1